MSNWYRRVGTAALAIALIRTSAAQEPPETAPAPRPRIAPAITSTSLQALSLRHIGPCLTPGRVGDIAIDPRNRGTWYVAMASGGLWKTTNRGVTWKPIFDQYGSYSIGCVSIDSKNPDHVWLGTGENQSQRSVGFGDGVYKSSNGGESWTHLGLKHSEHIARIVIDPRYSDVVYVAAQGPLWKEGGDRGLFKTTNGGKTWKSILAIGEHTGVTDLCFDPRIQMCSTPRLISGGGTSAS